MALEALGRAARWAVVGNIDGSALVDTEEVLSGLVPLLPRLLARWTRRFGLMWRWRALHGRPSRAISL
jgi:hypothetical protein